MDEFNISTLAKSKIAKECLNYLRSQGFDHLIYEATRIPNLPNVVKITYPATLSYFH